MTGQDIPKAYSPGAIERRWAEWWVNERLFTPEVAARHRPPDRGTFSLAIPPPNVTGSLHMGHMLEHTQIDILMRWRRMQGYRVLWLPGTDHASIAVHVLLERELAAQGLTRQQLGREEFLRRAWQWKAESGDTIKQQMIRLGASVDWGRECFTMDSDRYRAVLEAFIRLYDEKLIYRGRYLINWCPRCLTALSDLEVVHEERDAKLYFLRYPVLGTDRHLTVATTRPETMLGDTAVAVHPADDRYRQFVGRKALLPLMKREIPILADEIVDREFGTGAVKVTPAHDPNDFELARRHHLPEVDVMDDAARMNQNAGPYAGLDRYEARQRVVADLEKQGLLEKVEPYRHALGTCQRCKTPVEPRVSVQWFCRMKELAAPAIDVVRRGLIRVLPENNVKVYLNWMENIRDWCISRQLWWGHRIPVWHCACGGMTRVRDSRVAVVNGHPQPASPPEKCEQCGNSALTQDPDVLDTWFSSALWPFSTLGWPDDTPDLRDFYPTTLMINGFDILFFWDARMIMAGLKFMPREKLEERIPFKTLYIHALVRDPEGRKMSKTRGNVVDPLDLIEEYGTDACRFTLALMAAPGTDIALSPDRLRSYRAFANKIWNAARFIALNLQRAEQNGTLPADFAARLLRQGPPENRTFDPPPAWVDRWLASRLHRLSLTVGEALDNFRFHEAAHELYHFFWHEFCDWYLEWVKPVIAADPAKRDAPAPDGQRAAWSYLLTHFEWALRLLHPFMPFITEELWRRLYDAEHSLALQHLPRGDARRFDSRAEEEMALVQEAIVALRNIRAEMRLDARRRVPGELATHEPAVFDLLEAHRQSILRLANLSELRLSRDSLAAEGGVLRHAARFDARIPFSEADLAAELKRLRKEREKLEKELSGMRTRLADRDFRAKAPEDVVRGLEQRQAEYNTQYEKVTRLLETLENRLSSGGAPAR
ncbi:MAG: valine--tRNA ligase [Acidobacteria bacterium]|nr:valine--tRNA ligase [Acidobacteriota bacterium]